MASQAMAVPAERNWPARSPFSYPELNIKIETDCENSKDLVATIVVELSVGVGLLFTCCLTHEYRR